MMFTTCRKRSRSGNRQRPTICFAWVTEGWVANRLSGVSEIATPAPLDLEVTSGLPTMVRRRVFGGGCAGWRLTISLRCRRAAIHTGVFMERAERPAGGRSTGNLRPMKARIDAAGRVVIPKRLREHVGLAPGTEVDISVDGAALRLEAITSPGFDVDDGFRVVPSAGRLVTDAQIRTMRTVDQL